MNHDSSLFLVLSPHFHPIKRTLLTLYTRDSTLASITTSIYELHYSAAPKTIMAAKRQTTTHSNNNIHTPNKKNPLFNAVTFTASDSLSFLGKNPRLAHRFSLLRSSKRHSGSVMATVDDDDHYAQHYDCALLLVGKTEMLSPWYMHQSVQFQTNRVATVVVQ